MVKFTAALSDDDSDGGGVPFIPIKPLPTQRHHYTEKEDVQVEEEEEDEEEEDAGMSSGGSSGSGSAMDEGELELNADADSEEDSDAEYAPPLHESGSSDGEEAVRRSVSVPAWIAQGADAQRAHVMQAALFRVPEQEAALRREGLRSSGRARSEVMDIGFELPPTPYPEPSLYTPARKYPRVAAASSVASGAEGAFVDAGLAFGRSFRASWGPGGTLVHLGKICSPHAAPTVLANSSLLHISKYPFEDEGLSAELLQLHLTSSPIAMGADGIPAADPSPSLTFASFAALYPPTDVSPTALLFRLGAALFDPLPALPPTLTGPTLQRITDALRKARFSAWLEAATAPAAAADLRRLPADAAPARIFAHLAAHQIVGACDAALAGSMPRLATLLAQADGDADLRADTGEQLTAWKNERVDAHIPAGVRRVYALLAGEVDLLEGSSTGVGNVAIMEGLDWRRALGLHLWYGAPPEASLADVVASYTLHREAHAGRTPAPSPEDAPLALLLGLYADPQQPLATLVDGAGPLGWCLYVLLSRCLRARDFADRGAPGEAAEGEERVEGHSPSADLLASSAAAALEAEGRLQEAVFVLLHLEAPAGRAKAVKDLLVRAAPALDDWVVRGLAGSLKVPLGWVNEARAMHAYAQGDAHEAYALYVQAGLLGAAHDVAVAELAPGAALRDDLDGLRELFGRMAGAGVPGWHLRGKAFLDYAETLSELPALTASVRDPGAVPDGAQAAALDERARALPRLLALLPDAVRGPALAHMSARLVRALDAAQPLALGAGQVRAMGGEEEGKMRHLRVAAGARFAGAVRAAAAAQAQAQG